MEKIAVVTGASSGLGQEYIRILDARPKEKLDEIWAIARRQDRLNAIKEEVNIPVRTISADLTRMEDIAKIADLYASRKPDVRLLINAAGMGKIGSFKDISIHDTAAMVDLDCRAPVLMCQETIPYMGDGARILNVCSTASFSPFQFLAVYSAGKAFLYRYSRALRVELLSRHISVTAVCPYWIKDTEFIPVANSYVLPYSATISNRIDSGELRKKGNSGISDMPGDQLSRTERKARVYIRHFPLSSRQSSVCAWSLSDTYRRLPVSTPGIICILHRAFAKVIPSELMMGMWAILRRI